MICKYLEDWNNEVTEIALNWGEQKAFTIFAAL